MRHNSFSLPVSKGAGRRRARAGSKLTLAAGGLLAVLALAGCAGAPSSPFLPASTNAKAIHDLFLIVYAIVAVVFVLVAGMLVYTAVRFSRKRDATLPPQIEGNTRLEVAWTVIPAAALVVIFAFSLQTLFTISSPPPAAAGQAETSLQVRVIGHRWWWEFVYPSLNITTANELYVPTGVDLALGIESVDVIHSFWVPNLGGKKDGIPGHVNPFYLRVTEVGMYLGQCAEYCGTEHADMRLRVIAEAPDQFQAWVQRQQAPMPDLSGEAARGLDVFMKGACVACHTLDNTAAKGMAGPNLTHFATRKVFAGAVVDNTPENLARWLANPGSMKPGVTMPNLNLPPDQISALTAFLEALK